MSGATTPARRLLALLEEQPSLETRPRDEVAADLAALGIDPAGPILLARRLAERSSGPAATLLGAVIEDEAAEAEIAALESADIDDVRSRLQIGTVAAVTAEARRRAGASSNVVGIARHRRGAFWAWTGSLVGVAAGVLIVVTAWWPPSELSERPQIVEAERAVPDAAEMRAGRSEPAPLLAEPTPSSSPAAPPVVAMEAPRPAPEAAALGDEPLPSPVQSLIVTRPTIQESIDSARSVEADDSPESVTAAAPQPATSPVAGAGFAAADPIVGNLAEQGPDASAPGDLPATPPPDRTSPVSRISREAVAPPLPPPTPAERLMEIGDLAAEPPAELGSEDTAGARSDVEASPTEAIIDELSNAGQEGAHGAGAGVRGLSVQGVPQDMALADQPIDFARVSAFLVVDPRVAPSVGLFLFSDRGVETIEGDLPRRLAEANRAAAGRHIVALAGLEGPEGAYDVMIVLRDPASNDPVGDPLSPRLAALYGDRAALLEQIRLPPR